MSSTPKTWACVNCGHAVQACTTADIAACPKCGGDRWSRALHCGDKLTPYDELGAAVANEDGGLIAERIQKTDLNTSANLSADAGQPSKISVERKQRVSGFEEERFAAEALGKAYNKLRNTNYRVAPKTEEDSDYADRILASCDDDPPSLNVQIRHLDSDIIAGVGKQGAFDGDRTERDIIEAIRTAIHEKAKVDPKVKAKTILQLIVPAPLGEGFRLAIETEPFDFSGFKEVWVSPFHEESFPLASIRDAQ